MDYLNIITALEGTKHFDLGLIILNALPRSGQLTFIGRGDTMGWVHSVARRKHVDHEELMETLLFMVEQELLIPVELGIGGLYMLGIPSTFSTNAV